MSKKENNWLNQYQRNITSQHGEDGIIEKILELIPEKDNWCVEFGAWDGKMDSNTYNLINSKSYSAVLIEGDRERFGDLETNYESNGNVIAINTFVGFSNTNNLDTILKSTQIPKNFDLLSIDVDGNDYHIWNTLKNYRPKVVIVEFNPTIPNEIEFIQNPDSKINHGNSILSLCNLAKSKSYELIAATLNNAFFVDSKYFNLFEIQDNSVEKIREDKSRITYVFSGYDGTLFIRGFGKIDLHNIPIYESKIQQLPKFLRGWGDKNRLKIFLRRIYISLKKRKII